MSTVCLLLTDDDTEIWHMIFNEWHNISIIDKAQRAKTQLKA